MKPALTLLACAVLGAVLTAPAAATTTRGEALPNLVLGGALSDPVIIGDRVHVPSGRIVSTWDHSDPAQPVLLASTAATPVDGVIRGLTRWDDYLYASWQAIDGSGGVAVFSLADPAAPALVNQFSDYSPMGYKNLWTIAAVNNTLFVFDAENGIYFGDLASNPEHPAFTRLLRTPTPFRRSQVVGDHLFISGTTVSSEPLHVCAIIDVTNPAAPALQTNGCGSGLQPEHFSTRVQAPYAMSFGLKLGLYDIADPSTPVPLGSIDTDPATDGFMRGDHVYSLGFGEIAIHDISNPLAPATVGYAPARLLGAESVTPTANGALVLTSTDRFVQLGVAADDPQWVDELSASTPAGGIVARDIALHGDRALILQENYGFTLADPDSLDVRGRFDADLPMVLNQRAIEQFAVDGDRAYLGAWGYGLIVAELGFASPFELGRLEFPSISAIAAQGDFVYLGTSTGGGTVQVVDVSVPAKPTLRGSLNVSTVNRLQVHGQYLYVADELTGVRVIDIAKPDAPAQVALWNTGCADPGGYSARDIELHDDGALAAVGCSTGLHLLDLSNPAQPVRVGGHPAKWASARVSIDGDQAWYADTTGLKGFDISQPSEPVLTLEATLVDAPRRVRATGDGRVFVFGNESGVHVFGERKPAQPDDVIFSDGFDTVTPP